MHDEDNMGEDEIEAEQEELDTLVRSISAGKMITIKKL